jgi:hypothetical protein
VIGPDDDVVWPDYSEQLDFELEFGCYIAGRAKNVPRDRARQYIFGYTIFNDVSARDAQAKEMSGMLGPAKGKDFDTANVMGPCLVTADELGDPYDLTTIARVNGEEWGRGNTRDMRWRFEDVIAHISRSETLYPGEFLGSGTVGNDADWNIYVSSSLAMWSSWRWKASASCATVSCFPPRSPTWRRNEGQLHRQAAPSLPSLLRTVATIACSALCSLRPFALPDRTIRRGS